MCHASDKSGIAMAFMNIRLNDETHAKWKEYCAGLGLQPSTAVRRSIEQQVSGLPDKPDTFEAPRKTREPAGGQKKVRVSVWLTESEREGIRLRTTLHGGNRAGWIINLIRAALTREPQLGDDEIDVLKASNFQLLSIGRNLNQIARRLNEGQTQQSVEMAMLDELRDKIDMHTAEVNHLIRSNTERWVIE